MKLELSDQAIEPLEERESIEQRVAQALRALIVARQLPEGTQPVQRALAARLGVSQTPVRASLGPLATRGLRRRRRHRPGVREPADTGGLRGDLRRPAGARRPGGAPRRGAWAPTEPRRWSTLTRLERAAAEAGRRRLPRPPLGVLRHCYRTSGRRRLAREVERLYRRSERYSGSRSRRRDGFRTRWTATRPSSRTARRTTGPAAERDVQDSLRWAVDTVAPGLPRRPSPGEGRGARSPRRPRRSPRRRRPRLGRRVGAGPPRGRSHLPPPAAPRPRRLPDVDRRRVAGARARRTSRGFP